MPASAALAAARLGMDVVIARPAGFDLDPEDAALIATTAGSHGGSLALADDQDAACGGADAIYAKAWGGLDRFEDPAGEAARRHGHRTWQVRSRHVAASKNGAGIVMHCLPVRRNVEIEDAGRAWPGVRSAECGVRSEH